MGRRKVKNSNDSNGFIRHAPEALISTGEEDAGAQTIRQRSMSSSLRGGLSCES